jgi:hypothetical protein
MAAGKYSFTIEQGATVNFEIAYKDSNGNPVNLTGYQARMQLRPEPGSDIVYLTLSSSLDACGTGLNMSGSSGLNPPTSGTIGIYISAASSSQLNFDLASYDLEIASGNGNCYVASRLLEGKVKLSKEVTKGSY